MKATGAMKSHIEAADPVTGTWVLRGTRGQFVLVQHEGRALVFRAEDRTAPLGSVVPGCSWAGSIWLGSECVGEYERRDDAYRVTPIEDRNRQPDRVAASHPVDFLLARVESRAAMAQTPAHARSESSAVAR